MSFYKYCSNCNCEMEFPDVVDSLIGKTKCKSCDEVTDLDYEDRRYQVECFVDMISGNKESDMTKWNNMKYSRTGCFMTCSNGNYIIGNSNGVYTSFTKTGKLIGRDDDIEVAKRLCEND